MGDSPFNAYPRREKEGECRLIILVFLISFFPST
jgi:hypothetical protein